MPHVVLLLICVPNRPELTQDNGKVDSADIIKTLKDLEWHNGPRGREFLLM